MNRITGLMAVVLAAMFVFPATALAIPPPDVLDTLDKALLGSVLAQEYGLTRDDLSEQEQGAVVATYEDMNDGTYSVTLDQFMETAVDQFDLSEEDAMLRWEDPVARALTPVAVWYEDDGAIDHGVIVDSEPAALADPQGAPLFRFAALASPEGLSAQFAHHSYYRGRTHIRSAYARIYSGGPWYLKLRCAKYWEYNYHRVRRGSQSCAWYQSGSYASRWQGYTHRIGQYRVWNGRTYGQHRSYSRACWAFTVPIVWGVQCLAVDQRGRYNGSVWSNTKHEKP